LAKKYGIDEQNIDFESIVDGKLSYGENLERIKEEIKKLNPEIMDEEFKNRDEEFLTHCEAQARRSLEQQILEEIGDKEPVLDFNETNEEIEKYTWLGSEYTYSTLFSLFNGISVINYGNVGCGKSRSTVELLKLLNMPKTLVFSGYLTAKRFFKIIKNFNDCLIVFDEGDLLLGNPIINQMIKSLLTSKKAVWESDKDQDETDFEGSLIINCNSYKFNKGIEDKVLVNQKGFSTEDYKEKIRQSRNYKPNMKVWEKIRERIIFIRNNGNIRLNEKEEDLIYEFILSLPVIDSYRVKHRVFDIFTSLKKLYGVINKDVFELGKKLCNSMINTDAIFKIIQEIDETIERKELAERIANVKRISTRQAQRIINDLLERGILKKINRTTLSKTS